MFITMGTLDRKKRKEIVGAKTITQAVRFISMEQGNNQRGPVKPCVFETNRGGFLPACKIYTEEASEGKKSSKAANEGSCGTERE